MGYHETMTVAWMSLIDCTMRQFGSEENSEAFFDAQPQLTSKRLLRLFYLLDQICTDAAKKIFVPPDLTEFPKPRS